MMLRICGTLFLRKLEEKNSWRYLDENASSNDSKSKSFSQSCFEAILVEDVKLIEIFNSTFFSKKVDSSWTYKLFQKIHFTLKIVLIEFYSENDRVSIFVGEQGRKWWKREDVCFK